MGVNHPFTIYIGYDSREAVCSYVAAHSIARRTSANLNIKYLNHRDLRRAGVFARPWMTHGEAGETIDVLDGKSFSTEFSHTRFLVPHLMKHRGWALFMDADMIALCDITKLFALCDDKYAAMCVKHVYPPRKDAQKMDGRAQRFYHRKNWSSFTLWNCGHAANLDITPEKVNFLPGRDLHAFAWLEDPLIGALPFTYNYISGISPKISDREQMGHMPSVIHYSDGGPWFDECQNVPYADAWIAEYEDWQRNGGGNKYSAVPTTRYER